MLDDCFADLHVKRQGLYGFLSLIFSSFLQAISLHFGMRGWSGWGEGGHHTCGVFACFLDRKIKQSLTKWDDKQERITLF